ncbi:MAG: UbiX family flavin prenyltransferase [Hyphomicrobiaceae bacterium]|nr:UbiX family flavin prenyltransferase [Hyphomicrobiaceae bacterium]
MTTELPIVVAVTGASGAALGVRVAERLASIETVRVHLVVTDPARRTLAHEAGPDALDRLRRLAHEMHDIADVGASIASGSFPTHGMIVAPCSMRTLSAIAAGIADNLVVRAADVHLKERRRLVLMARETPLHLGHLRAMVAVTEMGAIVMPPVPSFYNRPADVAAIVDHLAAKAIDLLGLPIGPLAPAWHGLQ